MGDGHDEREDADGGTDSTGHPNSAPASVGRRSFLMGGLAGLVAGGVGSVVATQTLPNSLRVTKAGAPDGKAEFSVTVSGDLEPADDFEDPGSDSIDGDTATGIIGPESGTDTVRYSGDITSFSLDGPALVYRNGERVDPGTLGEDVVRLPQRLSVTKDGAPDGKAEFSVTVSGSLEPADDFEDPGSDSIDGTTATGIIGPEGGTDTVQYSGGITDFSLDGPAIVYRNGGRVDPDDLGRPGQVRRITPVGGEVTVAPRTEVMFEIAAPTLTGDALTTQWAIDGEDLVTQPGQPAWQDS